MALKVRNVRGGWMIAVWLTLAVGCAGAPTAPAESHHSEQPAADPTQASPSPTMLGPGIWEVATGVRLEEEALIERLARARYVLAAESHDDPWHHRVQERVYRGLSQRAEGPVALGVEMVEARFQPALDAYVAARIDEAQMLHGVEWESRWGVDWALYAPMWRIAREFGAPIVALNAPREQVRRVGRGGLEKLGEEERAALPDLDLSDASYRAWLGAIFASHGMGDDEEALDRFFAAQVLWDETMADNAVAALTEHPDIEAMVLLVGRGHAERGFGIAPRIARRLVERGEARAVAEAAVVVIVPVSTVGEFGDRMEDYRRLEYLQENNIADFVWIEAGDANAASGATLKGLN
ncbi:ChaN family lipoprotein [Lujinxingia vulgaris]|uniref:ChaN family lipoprotein n=2 Tax=Lujinxingia vulgaris TaxID=2600176 RepID=A0A5C6X1Z7_9DELT|nr:ChaN family lipoprotein [Lujinxingia vulgaris]